MNPTAGKLCIESSSSEEEAEALEDPRDSELDKELASWFEFSQTSASSQFVWTNVAENIERLPRRRLPPGCTAKLYLVYVAECHDNGNAPGSYKVFREEWLKKWRKVLEFSNISGHAACNECYAFKQSRTQAGSMRNIDAFGDQFENVIRYQRHLALVWKDRNFVWSCMDQARNAALSGAALPFLFICADAMDQAIIVIWNCRLRRGE
jgi:hypothetical protein